MDDKENAAVAELQDRRYAISEVSEITGVAAHVLRQWEKRFSRLRPKRDRVGRRYYLPADIAIVREIKFRIKHKGMTSKGVEQSLAEDIFTTGRPRTRQDAMDLIRTIESEVQAMLDAIEAHRPA